MHVAVSVVFAVTVADVPLTVAAPTAGSTVTFATPLSVPVALSAFCPWQVSVSVPAAPAVNVIWLVVPPELIVPPPVMFQR